MLNYSSPTYEAVHRYSFCWQFAIKLGGALTSEKLSSWLAQSLLKASDFRLPHVLLFPSFPLPLFFFPPLSYHIPVVSAMDTAKLPVLQHLKPPLSFGIRKVVRRNTPASMFSFSRLFHARCYGMSVLLIDLPSRTIAETINLMRVDHLSYLSNCRYYIRRKSLTRWNRGNMF